MKARALRRTPTPSTVRTATGDATMCVQTLKNVPIPTAIRIALRIDDQGTSAILRSPSLKARAATNASMPVIVKLATDCETP
jgi:hypothetical protein